ncbi:phosphatidylinositol kinase [Duganella sp. Leaf61]|uniref:type II toxin-antitoxin system HipA family toxin n=1 Tax=Duganella sp. Leaf61 TaxID=1736227 RepID=UPI0006F40164|nr:type II toxin-antitoxin system HipA family toxin [Duganella sp. Leaf61]KQN79215.1 phosphatidylinositol kinase [Duganella sp. Leaf61]
MATHQLVSNELYLWFIEEPDNPRLVGTLNLVTAGKGVSLTYAPTWLASGFPLSEDLPLVDIEHLPRTKEVAAGAVDDARPDRWGERVIRFIDKPARLSLMEFLYYAGDDRFGALGVSTSQDAYLPRIVGPLPRLESAQKLSEIIAKISGKEPITELEGRMAASGGSFGGAKPKALIEIGGEQWVIKFFNNEPVDVPLIEHATMTLCGKAGITVAETRLVPLAGENAIAVRRFDRKGAQRVHCISAGTAMRALVTATQEPDLSYPNLAQLLRRSGRTASGENRREMAELFRRMVFNILIDNTDDHEKNHTLLVIPEPAGKGASARVRRLALAPAYDVLPTNSGQGHQELGVGADGRDSTLVNAMSQHALFGLTAREACAEVAKVILVVDGWKEHFQAYGVSAADIEELAQRIDGEALLSQRRGFRTEAYADTPPRARRSPLSE